jgi:glutathione S-transferase
MTAQRPVLVARSSSHFSRIARIYAAELGVECVFEPVFDIKATQASVFADNPLLRVPSLRTPEGTWFGSIGVCRELARRATPRGRLLWPEDLSSALGANAHEVTLDALGTGVTIIMARVAGFTDDAPLLEKPFARLHGALDWLEANLDAAIASLPERQLSFLEVSAFCFLTHLEFRQLGSLASHPTLRAFCAAFGAKDCARTTPYYFDKPPAA